MDPSSLFFILAVLILLGLGVIAYFLRRLAQKPEESDAQRILMEWLKEMRGSLDQNLGSVQQQLQRQSRALNERLDRAARVIGGVQRELGTMSEIGKQMKDLQDFLQSPKLRGGIGEQVLRDLLEQILPRENYVLQHTFKRGSIETVDAIVKTDRGVIPIDSKFPMENFKRMMAAENDVEKGRARRDFVRDVKKHVDAISRKYIRPAEGTVDFAIMYIPSEPVYYETVMCEADLNTYAWTKKVLFVSPNSFYYFLRIVLMGLQEKRIAEGARQILETLNSIRHEAARFGEDLSVLSGHITRAKNSMDNVSSKYQILSGRIDAVRLLGKGKGDGQSPLELKEGGLVTDSYSAQPLS